MKVIASTILLLSLSFFAFAQEARKIDEFGYIPCEEWLIRLSSLFTEIKGSQNSKAYIVYYGGRFYPFWDDNGNLTHKLTRRNEARARVEYFKSLPPLEKFLSDKVVFLFGGYQENFKAEFWIVPNSGNLPKLQPTIKIKNIKFRKGKVTKKELFEFCAN